MIQLTVLLGLLGVGVVALVVGHVRRSRRGSARAPPDTSGTWAAGTPTT